MSSFFTGSLARFRRLYRLHPPANSPAHNYVSTSDLLLITLTFPNRKRTTHSSASLLNVFCGIGVFYSHRLHIISLSGLPRRFSRRSITVILHSIRILSQPQRRDPQRHQECLLSIFQARSSSTLPATYPSMEMTSIRDVPQRVIFTACHSARDNFGLSLRPLYIHVSMSNTEQA